jgi:hypothetical protein
MIVMGEKLASWEEELQLGWLNATGGIGMDIRKPLFIEQPNE